MEGFEGFVRRVVGCFNAVGLDYMFIGALAVSYYGRARTTTDMDVVTVSGREWRARPVSGLEDAGMAVDEKIDAALKSGLFTYRVDKAFYQNSFGPTSCLLAKLKRKSSA